MFFENLEIFPVKTILDGETNLRIKFRIVRKEFIFVKIEIGLQMVKLDLIAKILFELVRILP